MRSDNIWIVREIAPASALAGNYKQQRLYEANNIALVPEERPPAAPFQYIAAFRKNLSLQSEHRRIRFNSEIFGIGGVRRLRGDGLFRASNDNAVHLRKLGQAIISKF